MVPDTDADTGAAEQKKQALYRDARFTKQYDDIWRSVGKCVFCDLRDKYIVFEEHGIVLTISLFAYIDGHCMIVPRRHVRSPKDLTQAEWQTIRKFAYIAKKLVKETYGISGMQIVQKDGSSAQSTVDQHLHFHCIPFDAPDLCVWNYRKLAHTPLENVALYKKNRKKIIEHSIKFDKKYQNRTDLRVIVDAVIINDKREVLFQERHASAKLSPDYLTLPGGAVDDFDVPLETELAREVLEETSLDIAKYTLRLGLSRISKTTYVRTSAALKATYPGPNTFLWNTYLVESIPEGSLDTATLHPADDCSDIVWIPLDAIASHPRMSAGMKQTFKELAP